LLGLYTHWGWLNPDHWSFDVAVDPTMAPGATQGAPLQRANPVASAAGNAKRTAPRPEAPWPDEPAVRQQLGWRGLRTLSFKTGSQRAGTTEVRLDLQWQGPLAECLDMLQTMALLWPQMRLDVLTLQAKTAGEWRVEWRGWWRKMVVPNPLPRWPIWPADFKKWATHPVFNAALFQSHQAALWRSTQGGRHLLPWMRPDQLQWVAYVHGEPPQAWVSWQQHTVAIAVGDRVGLHGGVVRSISPREIAIVEGDLVHRLRPRVATPNPSTTTGSGSQPISAVTQP
jgi:hypothetical protein